MGGGGPLFGGNIAQQTLCRCTKVKISAGPQCVENIGKVILVEDGTVRVHLFDKHVNNTVRYWSHGTLRFSRLPTIT